LPNWFSSEFHLLNRREVILMGAGATGAVALAGLGYRTGAAFAQSPVVATPALTEGPYFVDEMLNRSDIRVDPSDGSITQGFPLRLGITVSRIDNGAISPLTGAYVDIWHCDALGVYSDVQAQNTVGRKFLRGYQVTDRHGNVRFLTIYPGWYQGRTAHIHNKVRLFAGSQETYEFTTQFFFDEAITDAIHAMAPYNQKGRRDTFNNTDGIFNCATSSGAAGTQLLLRLAEDGSHAIASFHVALDLAGGNPSCGGSTPPPGPPPGGGGNPPPGSITIGSR
jgi:protocatechuate 3,4-dioxygenase beta subunit